MKNKKIMALILASAMVVGSSIAVFAADGATSTGSSFDHLDREITAVTLPTDEAVANVFNYYIDPERVIDSAGKLTDGSTVTANADGVYFKNTDGGYSSSSDAVKFEGKNSVDVDVTVEAAVTASADADKDIALVADAEALTAATTPALLMTLKVGDEQKVITSEGATAKATIEGVPDNFAVTVDADNEKFVYGPKADVDASTWKSTTVQLIGKTNQKDIPDGAGAMTVPTITLTWTVAKHEAYTDTTATGNWGTDGLWLSKSETEGFSTTGLVVEVSDGGTTYNALTADQYTIAESGWLCVTWDNIVAGIGSTPTGTAYVRVTDGTTRYVFVNN